MNHVQRHEETLRSVQVKLSAFITANSNTRHWMRIHVNRPGSSDAFDLESSDLRDVRLTGDDLEQIEALCQAARSLRAEALYGPVEAGR